ncbi:hypothetical protein BMS_0567 [Halobacteriovorax marinus SJ]|uniref:Uncharacterized protein n=1 Tax=Halobacteriovorax marinus (strain ATCC BAA-682 / DSM 15412 / SJ) TaxID=862908 RepID=E1X4P7_HALMS|nr:hypothetical protein [Halobacteriovorax marinus]CBW25477.1 hypothetical protein BMS_0567 [Halobacteriovorax marinus SJ]
MAKDVTKEFEQGMQTLGDIQALGDFSLSPLIERASFHFSEIHRKAEYSFENLESYSKVQEFLEKTIDNLLTSYTLRDEITHQVLLQKKFKDMSLEKWDRLLDIIPSSLQVMRIFKFVGTQNIQISNEGICVRGLIKTDESIIKYRELIYKASRKLLDKKTILTYQIEELEDPRICWLTIHVDMDHDESLSYNVDFSEKLGMKLGFSNLFSKYKVTPEQAAQLPRHLIIEISEDLEISKYYRVPDQYTRDSNKKEMLHFSFLFHPVSIIIPKVGLVERRPTSTNYKDTGSGLGQQEVKNQIGSNFRYIDFFSLINQS